MSKPRLLDLFCGAGGAAEGYSRAGFEVVGVDIKNQPRYPFEFLQADALEYVRRHGHEFDVIHASPPCQRYSVSTKTSAKGNHPDLVGPVRDCLQGIGKPYIIENVPGAPLVNPIILCGTMFPPLRVIRHRLFESNIVLSATTCSKHPACYTAYKKAKNYGKLDPDKSFITVTGGGNCTLKSAAGAMQIDWMTMRELSQAIPPAYTEYIGQQIIRQCNKVSMFQNGTN